jgi:hypothetical protein
VTGFFGQLSYAARVDGFQPGPARRVELRVTGALPGPVLVRIDNSVAGWIFAPHDRLDISEFWRTGARNVEIVTQYSPDRLLAQLAGRPTDAAPALSPPVIVTLAQRVSA